MSIYKTFLQIKALYAVVETDKESVYPITNLNKSYRQYDEDLGDYNTLIDSRATRNYFNVNCSFTVVNRIREKDKHNNIGIALIDKNLLRFFKKGVKVHVIMDFIKDGREGSLLIHTGYVQNAIPSAAVANNSVSYSYQVSLADKLWFISQMPSGALFVPHSTGDTRALMESSIPQSQNLKTLIAKFANQRKELNIAEVAVACLDSIIKLNNNREELDITKMVDVKNAPRLRLKGYENSFIIKYILDIVLSQLIMAQLWDLYVLSLNNLA